MVKLFLVVLFDDKNKRACVRGPISDDSVITSRTCDMQAAGYEYRCSVKPYPENTREQIERDLVKMGYKIDYSLDW